MNNLEVVILAGGRGTRMEEVTSEVPKPMIEIGNKPILWHLMKIYSSFGIKKFHIALGYKGNVIKDFFMNYDKYFGSIHINLKNKTLTNIDDALEDWDINLIETGLEAETGTRLFRMKKYIQNENFFFTYGDGLSNVNLKSLYEYHLSHKKIATLTSVRPPSRFGALNLSGNEVLDFIEKPKNISHRVNGGFFVFNKKIFDYLSDDNNCVLESSPLEIIARKKELQAFNHNDFWQCMDTVRDRDSLNELWNDSYAPWKIWN